MFRIIISILIALSFVTATILENGQPRLNPYPGQAQLLGSGLHDNWNVYDADAEEISYKGRWDDQHISCKPLALSFGEHTSSGVLVAYRIAGLDWQFTNVTANNAYEFVGPWVAGLNTTDASVQRTFELRVTNWAYGYLSSVAVEPDAAIYRVEPYAKMVEIIGDSLSSGDFATYEGLSSWAYLFAAGLGNVEYSITTYQWYRTSDTSSRAADIYGEDPPIWDFSSQQAADLVVINIGTNDNNPANNVSGTDYFSDYVKLVENIHEIWPDAKVVLMSLWGGFGWSESTNTYEQGPLYANEIKSVYEHFQKKGDFVHYFDTTGILQSNDIAPQWHPTDVGHVKVAAHFMQWVKLKFGWEMAATGPMVHSGTLYWNDQDSY
ncbi:hypothetical protein BDV06DRAFT_214485 [Aspergillus oleicola]